MGCGDRHEVLPDAAGIVPPKTGHTPSTHSIGISPCGYPIQTHVASSGVYPQNHASTYSCAVPVLPAAGRPMLAAVPVPPLISHPQGRT